MTLTQKKIQQRQEAAQRVLAGLLKNCDVLEVDDLELRGLVLEQMEPVVGTLTHAEAAIIMRRLRFVRLQLGMEPVQAQQLHREHLAALTTCADVLLQVWSQTYLEPALRDLVMHALMRLAHIEERPYAEHLARNHPALAPTETRVGQGVAGEPEGPAQEPDPDDEDTDHSSTYEPGPGENAQQETPGAASDAGQASSRGESEARQGETRQGEARQGEVRQGEVDQNDARQDEVTP